ncbi:hypothetical protein [Mycolicibacterium sp. CR10]|uniref:hypothetical protein n=1 Tax=Mycolicibacterium sp. CR10 TaxID=2562314 RepID=UPI0010C0E266|nr:hypothetical protein [Mycolicibacterium sp. CR10]
MSNDEWQVARHRCGEARRGVAVPHWAGVGPRADPPKPTRKPPPAPTAPVADNDGGTGSGDEGGGGAPVG